MKKSRDESKWFFKGHFLDEETNTNDLLCIMQFNSLFHICQVTTEPNGPLSQMPWKNRYRCYNNT